MDSIRRHIPIWLLVTILIISVVVCALALWHIATITPIGEIDFTGYWSATRLLALGHNPYDRILMGQLQHEQLQTGREVTVMAWNPPTLFVFLLPLAGLPFTAAKSAWIIINVGIILAICVMLSRIYLSNRGGRPLLLFMLFACLSPQTLAGVYMGQVTFLVVLGLVACMMLIKKEYWFWAGAALILTTIKPHMVMLAVLYLLVMSGKKGKWQLWAGLIAAGMACAAVLFIARPQWVADLLVLFEMAPTNWATPTLGGLLSRLHVAEVTRYMILILLPLPVVLGLRPETMSLEDAVALLTLITVPTTFFGWSYDQTILLIPIAQVFRWLSYSDNQPAAIGIIAAILLSLGINYYQRFSSTDDLFYVWIPLFWWVVFGISWYFFKNDPQKHRT